MRYFFGIAFILLMSCRGKLTDRQRNELKTIIGANEIKKISEFEITEATFAYGRNIYEIIHNTNFHPNNDTLIDSLQKVYNVIIHVLRPADSTLTYVEQQLVEAYTKTDFKDKVYDNVQNFGVDSILYTVPIMEDSYDTSPQFNYALGIQMTRKQIILSMDKKSSFP